MQRRAARALRFFSMPAVAVKGLYLVPHAVQRRGRVWGGAMEDLAGYRFHALDCGSAPRPGTLG
jgi:hypothetical protein